MKIVLVTCGSRGDVQPVLALALGLQARGHRVLLAAPPENADWAGATGCPFYPVGRNVTAYIHSRVRAHTLDMALSFTQFVRSEVQNQFRVLPQIIHGADLALGASLAFALSSASEAQNIPYRYIAFTPQLFPSSRHPFPVLRDHGLPSWANRLSWWAARQVDRLNIKALINGWRRRKGLAPVPDAWRHILGSPAILATDPALGRVPPDVRESTVQTGYWHLQPQASLSRALKDFLNTGSPPVYVGFGSMPPLDQQKMASQAIRAVRSAGKRIILSAGAVSDREIMAQPDVFCLGPSPHIKLFPRLCAAVHHGGSGTTHTAAHAGIPQVIVSHILDQYYWGSQIFKQELGPRPIWRARFTEARLASALHACVSQQKYTRNARRAARVIQTQDSIGRAVEWIDALFTGAG